MLSEDAKKLLQDIQLSGNEKSSRATALLDELRELFDDVGRIQDAMNFPCPTTPTATDAKPSLVITNCDEVLEGSSLTVEFLASGYPAGTRVDMWVKHPSINSGQAQDVADSIVVDMDGNYTISNNTNNPIPQTGEDFVVCLRAAEAPYNFANAEDSASCTFTSATLTDALQIRKFCLNPLTIEITNFFGCAGKNYGSYVVPFIPQGIDYIPTSESQAQSFIDSMQPGEVLLLRNANDWSLNLNSTSGNSFNKKHIIGESDCDGSGPVTSTGIRFEIYGDNWMISSAEFNKSGNFGRVSNLGGSYNVFYNIKNVNNALAVFDPQGSYGNPQTVGNRFIMCDNTGPASPSAASALEIRAAFSNISGATPKDIIIGACTFRNYGDNSGKAVGGTGWFWQHPFYVGPTAPGPAPELDLEIVGCYFENCPGESMSGKTDRIWMYENLFDSNSNGHISYRSTTRSHCHSNVVISGSEAPIIHAGGTDSHFHFNIGYSGSNRGISIGHAALQTAADTSVFEPDGRYPINGQQARNVWKHNFILGPGSSAGYLRYGFSREFWASYPTEDNDICDNIFVGPAAELMVHGNSNQLLAAGAEATQAGFDNRNAGSGVEDQIWVVETSSDCWEASQVFECPTEIDTGDVWFDGRPIIAKINPALVGSSGLVVTTSI